MAKKPKVYLGIGHGGSDPGAVANGVKEKDANLVIGLACKAELERHGVEVMISRTKDITESVAQKVKECNAFKPDYAADLHNNAGGGDGAEVYHSIVGGKGKQLASNVLKEIQAIGQNSRGVKTRKGTRGDYYGFIRSTKCPAVIVECAFLDNKKDVQIIDTKPEQQAMGVAIAKGFLRQLKITWKAPQAAAKPTPAPTPAAPTTPGGMYRVFDKDGTQVGAYVEEANAFDTVKGLLKADGKATITLGEK